MTRGGGLNVVDLGGGSGYECFSAISLFKGLRIASWVIVEQPELAGYMQSHFEHKILRYQAEICDISSNIDLVIISGTLQFLPNPIIALEEVLAAKPKYVVLSRTPYWSKPTRLTQCMGWKHILSLDGGRLSYPFWILEEGEVTRRFNPNYRKLLDWPDDQNMYVSKFGFLPYRSLIFQRRSGT